MGDIGVLGGRGKGISRYSKSIQIPSDIFRKIRCKWCIGICSTTRLDLKGLKKYTFFAHLSKMFL